MAAAAAAAVASWATAGGAGSGSNDRSGASYDEAQHAAQLQKIMQMVRARPCAWHVPSWQQLLILHEGFFTAAAVLSHTRTQGTYPPAQRSCCLPPAQRAMHDRPAGGRSNGSNDVGSLATSSATDERARAEIDRMQQQVGALQSACRVYLIANT